MPLSLDSPVPPPKAVRVAFRIWLFLLLWVTTGHSHREGFSFPVPVAKSGAAFSLVGIKLCSSRPVLYHENSSLHPAR